MPRVTYRDALVRLATASQQGMRLGLDTTRALLAQLGDPQDGLRGVLVAGTNGKGSVCAMVAEIGRRSGLKVALLTKPHLTSYRERIRLGAEPISKAGFAALADQVVEGGLRLDAGQGRPTHHELLTAMGFQAAREWGAELVVCEVGLGGRLDASNVWDGGVAVIASIGLDHQAQLGGTIPEIAAEKAAIIKAGNRVVSGAPAGAVPAVVAAAERAGARLWQLGSEIEVEVAPGDSLTVTTPARRRSGLQLRMAGRHQADNAALAVAACDSLTELGMAMPDAAIRAGLADVTWSGRLEVVADRPTILVDAAHNPAAVAAVAPYLRERLRQSPGVLLFGAMTDHDYRGMLAELRPLGFRAAVFTRSRSARAADPEDFRSAWADPAEFVAGVSPALARCRDLAGNLGLVVCLGSIYLIGEVMASLGKGLEPDPDIPVPALW